MLDGLDGKVHIKIGPIEMTEMQQFDMQQLANRHILEPRKILEGQEQLSPAQQEPEAVLRHVSDFNARSVFSKQRGFRLRVSE